MAGQNAPPGATLPGLSTVSSLLWPSRPFAPVIVMARCRAGPRAAEIARIYQRYFPGEWNRAHISRSGPPTPDAIRDLVEHLIGLIDAIDLLPVDQGWLMVLDSEGQDARDGDVGNSPWPSYLDDLPLDLGQGFDLEGWLDSDGRSAAELLLGEAALACGVDDALAVAVAEEAPRLRRRVQRVRERLSDAQAVSLLSDDVAGAFAALPGALSAVPHLLRFFWAETGNRFLDTDPDQVARFYDLPWTYQAVQAMVEEWRDARAILSRVGDICDALHGNLAPVLAAIQVTLDGSNDHMTKGQYR